MNKEPYRVVRLQTNHLYPTYQLFASMENKKTSPQDGLKIAVLTVLDWLRRRLGEHVPEELLLPEPEEYETCTLEQLVSLHINQGFVIDIVSLPDEGIWSLQITEPDLGSDPGNPEQRRDAVPGRVIATNIGFRIIRDQLQCGFQTVISDVVGTEAQAEVYRLVVVKRLANNPLFGLKQISPLVPAPIRIGTVDQIRQFSDVIHHEENQFPTVVFTHLRQTVEHPVFPPLLEDPMRMKYGALSQLIANQAEEKKTATPLLPYDAEAFAKSCLALCRTYVVEDSMLERLKTAVKVTCKPGDILLIEPNVFGGRKEVISYKESKTRRDEALTKLKARVYQYPLGRTIDFGNIYFLTDAREDLVQSTVRAMRHTADISDEWNDRLNQVVQEYQEKLQIADLDKTALSDQLERQKQYAARLEREREEERVTHAAELEEWQTRFAARDEYIRYLERRVDRPKTHAEVSAWVKRYFDGRLLMHEKAEALLEEKSAKVVDLDLLCDALDYLATDYWENRYDSLSEGDMLTRCSQKYGRPFDITPVGEMTIAFTPGQYKVKYFLGKAGRPVESSLDWHLRVGNDVENLLRIYFLHDDDKQLIVIGSLPRHLKSVTVQ